MEICLEKLKNPDLLFKAHQSTDCHICVQKVIRFLRDAVEEQTTEATQARAEKLVLENEKKCLEKIKKDPPHNKSGTHTG